MGIYVVRMDHPNGAGWNTHVAEHVRYLQELIECGRLIASGPLKDTPLRAGFLIFRAATLDDVKAMIHADPFSRENLIVGLDIQQWDPLFGQLSELSSLDVPAELKGGQH